MSSIWDNEAIETEAVDMWQDGTAALAIANHISAKYSIKITRNSVVAKIHRLRAAGKNMRGRPLVRGTRVVAVKKVRSRPPSGSLQRKQMQGQSRLAMAIQAVPFKARPDDTKPKIMAVADLEQHHCRWPVGDVGSPDFGFCGETRFLGLPYCALHSSRAFQPPQPRKIVEAIYSPHEKKERQLV